MPHAEPFSPDDLYCVYCHAPAAGPCAACGALCCGDCVELIMGLIARRAVCRTCLAQGYRPAGARVLLRIGAPVLAVLALLLLLAYALR